MSSLRGSRAPGTVRPGSLRSVLAFRRPRVRHAQDPVLAAATESPLERIRGVVRAVLSAAAAALAVALGLISGWSSFLLLIPAATLVLEPLLWRPVFRFASPFLSRPIREIYIDAEAAEQAAKLYARGAAVDSGDRRAAAFPAKQPLTVHFRDGRGRTAWAIRWDGKRLQVWDRGGRTRHYATAAGGIQTGRLATIKPVGNREPARPDDETRTVVEIAMVRDRFGGTEFLCLLDVHSRRLVSAPVPPNAARRALAKMGQRAGVDFVRYRITPPLGGDFEKVAEALFPEAVGHWAIPERWSPRTFTVD